MILSFLSLGVLFAESTGNSFSGDLDLKSVFADKVQNLSFAFCDDTKSYFDWSTVSYTMRPGQTKSLCGNISSKYSSGLTIKYAFVNWSLTERKTVVCDQSLSWDLSYFPFYQDATYPIESKSSIIFRDRVHAPIWQTGTHYFCFVYWVEEPSKDKQRYINGMFDIVVRKSFPLKVSISWDEYRFQWWDDLVWQIKNFFYSKK